VLTFDVSSSRGDWVRTQFYNGSEWVSALSNHDGYLISVDRVHYEIEQGNRFFISGYET